MSITFSKNEAIIEARKQLFAEAETSNGSICPCCERFTKIYKRKFNKPMAESLLWLFTKNYEFNELKTYEYFSIGNDAPRHVVRNGGSLASCKWWDLVEQKENEDSAKHTSGMWRITNRGVRFIRGEIQIVGHIKTYNKEKIFEFDTQTTFIESLGRPFNYTELMQGEG